jgi:hypothetical protein
VRRRRIGSAALVLVLLAAAAIVGVNRLQSTPPLPSTANADRPQSAPAAPTPKDAVAWLSDDRIVVLSPRTGKIVRTLASGVMLEEPGLPNLSVAPDGTVFFDNAAATSLDTGSSAEGDQIYQFPITGGPVTRVASGYDPQVSPDGRTLAFIAPEAGGEAPYLDSSGGIDIGRITSGGLAGLRTISPAADQLNRGVAELSWSPDSHDLSFDLLNGSTDGTTFWTLAFGPGVTSLGGARQVPLRNQDLTWSGYWGHAVDGRTVGLGVLTNPDGAQQVVTLDPSTGRVLSTLFRVPGSICVALSAASPPMVAPVSPRPCASSFDNSLSSDVSGSDVLVAGSTHVIRSTGGQSTPYLYRWRIGGRSLVKLLPTALLATWGPQHT